MHTSQAQSTAASDYLNQVSSRLPAGNECELLLQELTTHVNDAVRERDSTTTADLIKKFGTPDVAARNLLEASAVFPTDRPSSWTRIVVISVVIVAILASALFVFTLNSTDAPSQPAQTTTVSVSG